MALIPQGPLATNALGDEAIVMAVRDDLAYWVAFSRVPSVGRVRFGLIEQAFGSLDAAWRAGATEFWSAGLDQAVVEAIATAREQVDPDREMELLGAAGIGVLT